MSLGKGRVPLISSAHKLPATMVEVSTGVQICPHRRGGFFRWARLEGRFWAWKSRSFFGCRAEVAAPNVQGGGFQFNLRAEVDRNPEAGEVSAEAEPPGAGRGRWIY